MYIVPGAKQEKKQTLIFSTNIFIGREKCFTSFFTPLSAAAVTRKSMEARLSKKTTPSRAL
jgi:hypothetical protein